MMGIGHKLLLLGMLFTTPIWGFEAYSELSPATIPMGRTTTYRVVISAEKLASFPDITFPEFPENFRVMGPSSSRSVQIVNGAVQSSITRSYVLVPNKPGRYTLASAEVKQGDTVIKTKPLTLVVKEAGLQVTQADALQTQTQNARQQQQLFAEAKTSAKEVFVGEQLDLDVSFYRRVRLWRDIAYDVPEIDNVWIERLPLAQKETLVKYQDRQFYKRDLFQYALFPLSEGVITIPPVRVGYVLNPLDGQRVVMTDAVEVTVKPLPIAGKPVSFSGVVGDFSLVSTLNTQGVEQHSPVIVSLTLSGKGNLKNIEGLTAPEQSNLKVYKSNTIDAFESDNGISGARTFEYVVIPKVSGEVRVPPFKFAYFSPPQNDYIELSSPPFTLTVSPATESSGRTLRGEVEAELAYLKPVSSLYEAPSRSLGYWSVLTLFYIVVLIFLGVSGMAAFRHFYQPDPEKVRQAKAAKVALKKLSLVDATQTTECYQILIDYLSDRTLLSLNGLGRDALIVALSPLCLPDSLLSRLGDCLDALSHSSYAPGAGRASVSEADIIGLITDIEEAL